MHTVGTFYAWVVHAIIHYFRRTASGNVQWQQAAAQAWRNSADVICSAEFHASLTGFEYHISGRWELWSKPAGHSVVLSFHPQRGQLCKPVETMST